MSGRVDYPDLTYRAERWAALAEQLPAYAEGDSVRIVGKSVSGIVVSLSPLTVRDGTGVEHVCSVWEVRSCDESAHEWVWVTGEQDILAKFGAYSDVEINAGPGAGRLGFREIFESYGPHTHPLRGETIIGGWQGSQWTCRAVSARGGAWVRLVELPKKQDEDAWLTERSSAGQPCENAASVRNRSLVDARRLG